MEEKNLKVLNFLRHIFDLTRGEFVEVSLSKEITPYNLPQEGVYNGQLIKSNILQKKHGKFKWIAETAPTLDMAQKLIQAVSDFWKKDKLIEGYQSTDELDTSKPPPVDAIETLSKVTRKKLKLSAKEHLIRLPKQAKSMLTAKVEPVRDITKELTLYSLIQFCKSQDIKMTIEI
jgi:hypothetical protein